MSLTFNNARAKRSDKGRVRVRFRARVRFRVRVKDRVRVMVRSWLG